MSFAASLLAPRTGMSRDAVEVVVDLLERDEFLHERRGGLRADARDALDVVDAVAHEREEIGESLRRDAEAVLDFVDSDNARCRSSPSTRRPARISCAKSLSRVTSVARRPSLPAARHQRADDVVGFVFGVAEGRNARVAAELAATLELQLEILGRRIAIRLVGGIDLVAKRGRQALVESHGDVARLRAFDEIAEKARETEGGVRGIAVAVHHVRRHGVVGAEDVDRRVDEVNHARMVNRGQRPVSLAKWGLTPCLQATWPIPPAAIDAFHGQRVAPLGALQRRVEHRREQFRGVVQALRREPEIARPAHDLAAAVRRPAGRARCRLTAPSASARSAFSGTPPRRHDSLHSG